MWQCLLIITVSISFTLADSSSDNKCFGKPGETGHCKSFKMRWSFYPEVRLCKSYVYGGCPIEYGGEDDENRFDTKAECEKECTNLENSLNNTDGHDDGEHDESEDYNYLDYGEEELESGGISLNDEEEHDDYDEEDYNEDNLLQLEGRSSRWPTQDRCSDAPASKATWKSNCKPTTWGYSWHADIQDCFLERNAACANTFNKFNNKEKCRSTCGQKTNSNSKRVWKQTTNKEHHRWKPQENNLWMQSEQQKMDKSMCRKVPLLFVEGSDQCEGPAARKVKRKVFYYDWNINRCTKSKMRLCAWPSKRMNPNLFQNGKKCIKACGSGKRGWSFKKRPTPPRDTFQRPPEYKKPNFKPQSFKKPQFRPRPNEHHQTNYGQQGSPSIPKHYFRPTSGEHHHKEQQHYPQLRPNNDDKRQYGQQRPPPPPPQQQQHQQHQQYQQHQQQQQHPQPLQYPQIRPTNDDKRQYFTPPPPGIILPPPRYETLIPFEPGQPSRESHDSHEHTESEEVVHPSNQNANNINNIILPARPDDHTSPASNDQCNDTPLTDICKNSGNIEHQPQENRDIWTFAKPECIAVPIYFSCKGSSQNLFPTQRDCVTKCVIPGEAPEESPPLPPSKPLSIRTETPPSAASNPLWDTKKSMSMASGRSMSVGMPMPDPFSPQSWQCTDTAALNHLMEDPDTGKRRRPCRKYDNTKGFTFWKSHCLESDYSGCIDTFNKFRDQETCKLACYERSRHVCNVDPETIENSCTKKLETPIVAYKYSLEHGTCERFDFYGCSEDNVYLDKQLCHEECHERRKK